MGWISALPWNQAPAELRERATEELLPCSAEQPGVRAVAEKLLVHGQEYLAVVKYSAPFAAEQLHSLTASISRVLQSLRRFSMELNKPRSRWTEEGIRRKIAKWLSGQFLSEVIRYQLESRDGQWRLQFDFDHAAFERLLGHRLGRTVLLTNRIDWTAATSGGQLCRPTTGGAHLRGLKDGEWLASGDRCITGPTAKSASMRFTACWASLCCSMCIAKPKPLGAIFPWNSSSKSCNRFSSSFCSIRSKARKARIARLRPLEANVGTAGFGQGAEAGRTAVTHRG